MAARKRCFLVLATASNAPMMSVSGKRGLRHYVNVMALPSASKESLRIALRSARNWTIAPPSPSPVTTHIELACPLDPLAGGVVARCTRRKDGNGIKCHYNKARLRMIKGKR